MTDRRERCFIEQIDGVPVRVRATRPLTDADRAALAELVHTIQEESMQQRHCRRCGAEISWAITLLGRRMPLDPRPTDDGNVAAWRDTSGELRARVLAKDEQPAAHEKRATPHFATCPNWGRPKPRKA